MMQSKKWTKWLVVGLAAVLVLGMTGCGSSAKDTSPIKQSEVKSLYTSPDDFKGRSFTFTAAVFGDAEKDGDQLVFQAWHDIEKSSKNTVIVSKDTNLDLKDGDYVRVKGKIDGKYSGENAFGGDVQAVQVTASSVEKISAVEAIPATKTVDVNKTVSQGGIDLTLKKVDWTASEMRLYLSVKNNNSAEASVYADSDGKIIQNSTQRDPEMSGIDYPQLSSDLAAGASSEGVVTFKNVDKAGFTYQCTGYNANLDELHFSFDVSVQ
jgi:hypothetical protein